MHGIGARLKLWRGQEKLTQPEAATRLGVPFRTYQNYEGGVRPPNTDAWLAFVRAGINAHWLLTGEGKMLQKPAVSPASPCAQGGASGGATGSPAGWDAGGSAGACAGAVNEAVASYGAARKILDPSADDRRQMLLVMLRTAEHKLTEPMTREVAGRILDLVAAWRPFAESDPALVTRINALRAAAEFYQAIND